MGCAAALVVWIAGCGSADPPPPKPPNKPAKIEEAPPPPPPECLSLSERCVAEAGTVAKVPGTQLAFNPPPSWLFAQEEEVTLAQTPDGGPCLAMASFENGDKAALEANRQGALDTILRSLALELPQPKKGKTLIDWKKPNEQTDVGKLKLDMWQVEGGARAAKTGPVLVFTFPASGRTVLGVGFVPSEDSSDADAAIMKSLETVEEHAEDAAEGATEESSEKK
jgi:hypothetical protein